MAKSIFWHDYETFGSDPRLDRPCQFAGIRTDEALNIIDEPVTLWCRPAPDFLPHPVACSVTGISPWQALHQGEPEAEFCRRVLHLFTEAETCVAGYNNLRFDDELTRHMLYRCFHDPYEREWKNGNSRWDIIDLLRATQALRPEGINWPLREDGAPSFRLEALTAANDVPHEGAHDALADVRATIGMARLVREKQPKLYDYLYTHRQKNRLLPLLDLVNREALLHVSGMFPATRGCLGIVMPLMRHPRNSNGVVVLELSHDPADWLDMSAEQIAARLFCKTEDLPAGEQRIALKTVHLNKCPVLAPLAVVTEAVQDRFEIDFAAIARHREQVLASADLLARLQVVFAEEALPVNPDPELQLYSGGFLDDHDRRQLQLLHALQPAELKTMAGRFHDARLPELLFRYRARNYPQTLDAAETARWHGWCRERLAGRVDGAGVSLDEYRRLLQETAGLSPALAAELKSYGDDLAARYGLA